MDKERIL
jgi:hypothetical protein